MAIAKTEGKAWLVPIAGPKIDPVALSPEPGGLVLGRHEQCQLKLPADADKVSRNHARFTYDSGRWRMADLNSRWGTFLNGVKVAPGPDMPLSEGDLLRITPWTFSFSTSGPSRRGLRASDDAQHSQTMVRAFSNESINLVANDMLPLLLESAAAIHGAADEKQLGELVIDAATRGTGLPNAALLRPLDAAGTVQVIVARQAGGDERAMTFSRSLLNTASTGSVAELAGPGADNISQSIVQMKIDTAICVPLMLGTTVAAYLYLDSRGNRFPQRLRPNATPFCMALGRMASLALANLKRVDMERRQALIEAELSAAAAAQRWILPRRNNNLARFSCVGESRPGAYLGGDFFDLIELDDHRIAVALGDVTGHGVAASVLMTATQGFLHAALQEHGEPSKAVNDLNRFINPRRSDDKFVTMWVGVFDSEKRALTYVDAGHGYALLIAADGTVSPLSGGDGPPVGIFDAMEYRAEQAPLPEGGRALVISDGIVEQYGQVPDGSGSHIQQHFDLDGVCRCMASLQPGADEIAALFDAVIKHAGTTNFQDDATAVLVKW